MKRKIFVTIFVTILMANCLKWNSSKSPVFAIIGTDNSLPGDVPAKFRISGIASGLTGSGLILQNDGGDDLAVASNGKFEFGKTIPDKSHYSVTVSVQPQNPVQFCSVANGTGIISEKDVTDISVNCSPGYSIGGTITGLTSIFTGNSYSISILSQPAGETCYISFPSGTVLSADVTSVGINCVSGTISGILSGGNVIVPSLISSPVLEKPSAAPAFSDFFAGASDFGPGFFDGYGNSAKFDKPYAITTDGLNIYVADSNNYAIRKVQISDGLVSTLATGRKYQRGWNNGKLRLVWGDYYGRIKSLCNRYQ
ncbi:MAG: hypothetical protein K8R21_09040 [Leptospira sp.]|nr:hypothetical protein [Leptospira sp.]